MPNDVSTLELASPGTSLARQTSTRPLETSLPGFLLLATRSVPVSQTLGWPPHREGGMGDVRRANEIGWLKLSRVNETQIGEAGIGVQRQQVLSPAFLISAI